MRTKIIDPSPQYKTPKEAFIEQLCLALATYEHAELSERIKRGLATKKTGRCDGKRNTSNSH
jgi:DNA invertase Pin-like site-specific DNA recombinase